MCRSLGLAPLSMLPAAPEAVWGLQSCQEVPRVFGKLVKQQSRVSGF